MNSRQLCQWGMEGPRRAHIITTLRQPLTALQLARREGIDLDRAGYSLWELKTRQLIQCLNRSARNNRVYWLTALGLRCQARLRRRQRLKPLIHDVPSVDWDLYGWVNFRHRSAIIRALEEPLQPATIKRRARTREQALRMSANNVRGVIKLFLRRGVVRRVTIPREHHPRYELTKVGQEFRRLLLAAEAAG